MLNFKNEAPYVEGVALEDIDKIQKTPYYIYSQAKISDSSRLINIENFGNTSSVTLPLLLTDDGYNLSKNRVLMVGFGVGLSWAAVDINLDETLITKHFIYER